MMNRRNRGGLYTRSSEGNFDKFDTAVGQWWLKSGPNCGLLLPQSAKGKMKARQSREK